MTVDDTTEETPMSDARPMPIDEDDDGPDTLPRDPDATLDRAYDERDAWVDTAAMYARNADYWRTRAEAAEQDAVSHEEAMRRRHLVFEALGEASMCWSETPTGVFDSDHAKVVGERLCAALNLPVEADRG